MGLVRERHSEHHEMLIPLALERMNEARVCKSPEVCKLRDPERLMMEAYSGYGAEEGGRSGPRNVRRDLSRVRTVTWDDAKTLVH